MFDDLSVFVQIVHSQGLSSAAKALGIPPATVTRRLQRLEQKLGFKLVNRNAHKFSLTHEGERHFEAYETLIAEMHETQLMLSREQGTTSGKLKILAPTNLANTWLRDLWPAFATDFPQIEIDLELSNDLVDIAEKKADLAVRVGPQVTSSLTQIRIGTVQTLLVASPDYLEKIPAVSHPSQLKEARLIGAKQLSKWDLHKNNEQSVSLRPKFSATANDLEIVASLTRDSNGISLLPDSHIQADLSAGRLTQVLPEWQGPARPIYLVWPSGRLLSKRGKLFKKYVTDWAERS